jgi:hypothetical protein
MADLSSLYPQPPAAQPPNALLSDPAKAIGILSGLQDYRIKQQQADALGHIPAALLAGQNISNQTAQMGQNETATQIAAHYFGTLPDNATPDDVYRMKMAIRAVHPNIPSDTINSVADVALRDPSSLKNGIATLRTMGLSPESMVSRVAGPPGPGGEPVTIPQTSAVRAGAMATGLAPGTPESMQGSALAYNTASEAAGKYSQRVNPLRQAIPILEGMKETDVGPTSEKWNDIKSTLVSLGAGTLAGIDPEKIKDYNELKKYFNQYSSQAAATLGPKTNDGLATAVTSNPNVHMDKLSALELSKVAMGVERMQQAGVLEFNDKVARAELLPQNYNKFMTDWATKQDPRAFVYDLMSKEQQDKLKKTLPPAELNKIRNGMNLADRHGLLGDVHHNE